MSIPLINIKTDLKGIFKKRLNKYLAEIEVNGKTVLAHVHDPGRLNELLFDGNKVLLKYEAKPHRKTDYDVIAAYKNNQYVLIHSGYHRKIAEKIIKLGLIDDLNIFNKIQAEVKYNNSRIDFKLSNEQKELWLEVKGCTLTENGKALFPDAPTKRGTKHLKDLIEIGNSAILILIFRKDSKCFMPNFKTDLEFAKSFKQILDKKIKVYPVLLSFNDNTVFYEKILPICREIDEI